uniref:Uncharacterized protein n=1 Tax=Rhizophora mucronata TaxID=61149 RepID=A0A2P2QRX1_RHIMU
MVQVQQRHDAIVVVVAVLFHC